MKFTPVQKVLLVGILALILGGSVVGFLYRAGFKNHEGLLVRVGGGEGFEDSPDSKSCRRCGHPRPCGCKKNSDSSSDSSSSSAACPAPAPIAPCPRVQEPDLSKYVLKSSVPAPNRLPDLSSYMLKTECPPVVDLSKYVLRSSVPKPQPVIIDNSSCKKDSGECPPCPRPRCPVVKCPPPTVCPAVADCPRQVCPKTVVKCKSEEQSQDMIRPFLAPLNMSGFGSA